MFGFAIGCYLFLGGLAGGLAAVASWAALCVPASEVCDRIGADHRRLVGVPLLAAALLVAASALCLLADTARPEAIGALFASPRANILTVGAWLLVALGVACAALALFWLYGRRVRHNKLLCAALGVAFALGLAVTAYSALYLAGIRAVPLWHSWWLVSLFVGSSLAAACALFVAMAFAARIDGLFPAAMRRAKVFSLVFLAVEAVSACAFALAALSVPDEGSAAAAATSAADLLFGCDSFIWWGGFVAVGVVGSAFFDLVGRRRLLDRRMARSFALTACACALVGTFSLRISVMMAGAHPVLGF
ncbi:NrfD/PsrC family molybdoenzyme membrane anchor subunit [Adlercreutzia sp. R7]|uniref:NrfD/PsrC family molybdoenzyme membrane anchor subunit n=1 Tax=Adlercreutzia wanghongyangiae TaxID=3111451 RepID=A0ABU6IK95_9ACTN|nr:NrfD/PsrC family molybdoenzyme membrane anchor subunit [Adlercreutzia sp. R7]